MQNARKPSILPTSDYIDRSSNRESRRQHRGNSPIAVVGIIRCRTTCSARRKPARWAFINRDEDHCYAVNMTVSQTFYYYSDRLNYLLD